MNKRMVRPATLPGFMELIPNEQVLFNRMLDTIRYNYERFGFLPIDTPVMEKAEVLLAKSGGETEQQIYRFKKGDTDIALRFDLTVPLARYVSQHFSDLVFPFRRYHIGKVYRGERAQKGRFREFYQCDIDIIGNGKLDIINDAEIPSIIFSTFKDLGFNFFTIKINNRKVLKGFFQWIGIENTVSVLRSIDKLDKIGLNGVKSELEKQNLDEDKIEKIINFIQIQGTNEEKLERLKKLDIKNDIFKEGLRELIDVNHYVKIFGVPKENYMIDLTIARGLDYYTGTIYETFLDGYSNIGSICSGGRYDNLAGHYTKQRLPGVGISIGLTRLFYQLYEAKLIEELNIPITEILVIPMEDYIDKSIKISNILRKNDIFTQVYLEKGRLGKKFGFADRLNIPYVLIIGEDEVQRKKYTLRNMKTGEQDMLSIEEIVSMFLKNRKK